MKKPQNTIFSPKDLRLFAAGHPARETFGPHSGTPFIALSLDGSTSALSSWLTALPCPVIGIGSGDLETACDVVLEDETKLAVLSKNIITAPLAALILVQHLRASESLSLRDKLTAESFAYGTLQNGPEFKSWLSEYKGMPLPIVSVPDMQISREQDTLSMVFNRPDTRNAIGVSMRDALCEALDLAISDPSITNISLAGNGATFSTGGAIEEFGQASDPASAHLIRSLRLPAPRLAQLQSKLNVHVNGAAIGAGAEVAAFGSYVSASSKAWFQLPELKYGLIPGAGGTASITQRIGRQKTAYMALSMDKVRASTALEWGLIDAIID